MWSHIHAVKYTTWVCSLAIQQNTGVGIIWTHSLIQTQGFMASHTSSWKFDRRVADLYYNEHAFIFRKQIICQQHTQYTCASFVTNKQQEMSIVPTSIYIISLKFKRSKVYLYLLAVKGKKSFLKTRCIYNIYMWVHLSIFGI